jgi:hypothetical protein
MCADLTSDNLPLSRTKMSEFSAISEIANHGKTHIDKHVVSLDGRVVFRRRSARDGGFGIRGDPLGPPRST